MRKHIVLVLLIDLFINFKIWSQTPVTSPEEYLGYKLGDAFTPHYKVTGYMEKICGQTSKAIFKTYGETYEGRSLNEMAVYETSWQAQFGTLPYHCPNYLPIF